MLVPRSEGYRDGVELYKLIHREGVRFGGGDLVQAMLGSERFANYEKHVGEQVALLDKHGLHAFAESRREKLRAAYAHPKFEALKAVGDKLRDNENQS